MQNSSWYWLTSIIAFCENGNATLGLNPCVHTLIGEPGNDTVIDNSKITENSNDSTNSYFLQTVLLKMTLFLILLFQVMVQDKWGDRTYLTVL